MTWHNPSAKPAFPLNYQTIVAKLEHQEQYSRARDKTFVYANRPNVKVMRGYEPDTVAVELFRTHIVTYYPNGDMVLNTDGYAASKMTIHWMGHATRRYLMHAERPNEWTQPVVLWGKHQYYDGMRINKFGEIISELTPVTMLVLNDAAKALLKSYRKIVREVYGPHLRMAQVAGLPKVRPYVQDTFDEFQKGEFNFDLMVHVLSTPGSEDLRTRMNSWVRTQWKKYVLLHSSEYLNEVPYQEK